MSLLRPPEYNPSKCQLRGQFFAGIAIRFEATHLILPKPTGDVAHLFHLICEQSGHIPPLGVVPINPTLPWDIYRTPGTNFNHKLDLHPLRHKLLPHLCPLIR